MTLFVVVTKKFWWFLGILFSLFQKEMNLNHYQIELILLENLWFRYKLKVLIDNTQLNFFLFENDSDWFFVSLFLPRKRGLINWQRRSVYSQIRSRKRMSCLFLNYMPLRRHVLYWTSHGLPCMVDKFW